VSAGRQVLERTLISITNQTAGRSTGLLSDASPPSHDSPSLQHNRPFCYLPATLRKKPEHSRQTTKTGDTVFWASSRRLYQPVLQSSPTCPQTAFDVISTRCRLKQERLLPVRCNNPGLSVQASGDFYQRKENSGCSALIADPHPCTDTGRRPAVSCLLPIQGTASN